MTAAIPSPDQPAEIQPSPAASAEPAAPEVVVNVNMSAPGAAAAEPPETARGKILDHMEDSADAGDQTTVQICAGTGLARSLVDPLLSRLTKQGVLERTAPATYRLAPLRPAPDPVPTPAETPRADGISVAQWVQWLHAWAAGEPWAGPGKPPDRETGIMVAGGGCLVPLAAWSTFLGERDALVKQQEADDALRARLVAAAFGNVHPQAKLGDLTAIKVMMASGIELDLIETAVRAKHDRRMYPKNPPLASWRDLFPKVAELYARGVLAPKMVARWNATLADPGATTAQSPTLRRAVSEIAPQKPAGAPEPAAGLPQPSAPSPAQGRIPDAPAANPDVVAPETTSSAPSTASLLLQRYGGTPDAILDRAVADVSDDDDVVAVMPAAPPTAGRDQIINAFRRNRTPSAPMPPSRTPADRDDIASRLRDRRQADGAAPVTTEGGRPWFSNPEPDPPSPSTLAYDELTEAFDGQSGVEPVPMGPAAQRTGDARSGRDPPEARLRIGSRLTCLARNSRRNIGHRVRRARLAHGRRRRWSR